MRITNNKLSNKIVDRMSTPTLYLKDEDGNTVEVNNVTSLEFDFLVYLSRIQNAFGKAIGVHHRDVMKAIECCKQSHYNVIEGLVNKEYITAIQAKKDGLWDFTILDNIFLNDKDDKKGYVNTNRDFLYTPGFRRLPVNAKKLCLKLLISYNSQTGLKIYLPNLAKWIGVKTVSHMHTYLESIKGFFPYELVDGIQGYLVSFVPGNNICDIYSVKSEKENFFTHKIKYFCRKFKVSYTMETVQDLIVLILQYASLGSSVVFGIICDILLSKRSIEPALINSLCYKKRLSL